MCGFIRSEARQNHLIRRIFGYGNSKTKQLNDVQQQQMGNRFFWHHPVARQRQRKQGIQKTGHQQQSRINELKNEFF